MKRLIMWLCIICCFLFSACEVPPNTGTSVIRTATEVETVYLENEDLFQNVAKELHPYVIEEINVLQVYPITSDLFPLTYNVSIFRFEIDTCNIESTKLLNERQCQEIQDAVAPLFARVDIASVSIGEDSVRFLLDYGNGKTAELHFTEFGTPPLTGFGIQEEIWINENWCALTTSD